MTLEVLQNPEETIRLLQDELAETNAEVLLLTMELEKRVEERTAALFAAQEELKKRNLELLNRTAQLEAVNKELETFSYSVSHDLQAPVRRINGFLTLLASRHQSELTSEAREFVDKACKCSKDAGRLIEDLLNFSRMGRAKMQEMKFETRPLIDEVLRGMAGELQGRNIKWNIAPLPASRGDQALLKQVWVNLLSNAVKYTRPRNPAEIEIGCVRKGTEVEFYVKDNGVGFDMAEARELFGVFKRLHNDTEFEGTGIGLANVQQIVHRHGGKIRAEAEPGKGATFYFTLPI